jgi:hypothetical protein
MPFMAVFHGLRALVVVTFSVSDQTIQ